MEKAIIAFFAIGFIITGILAYPVFTKWRQNRLKSRHLPCIWKAIIENNLPIYNRLSPTERRRLQRQIQVLLAEKQFTVVKLRLHLCLSVFICGHLW